MNVSISQRTLKNVVRATGIGAQSGAPVRVTLRPAPADHGVVFVRTDLAVPVRLPAQVDASGAGRPLVTLQQGDVCLATVEHLLAAFAGLGIDNVLVEVDAAELPLMDGSASPFVFLIQSAGIATQPAPRRYLRILATHRVESGDRWAELHPHHGCRVDYTLCSDHPEVNGCRSAGFELSPTVFVREISRARAFSPVSACAPPAWPAPAGNTDRLEDLRPPSLDGLRLGDEFVRHEILDVVGDLALLGVGLIGGYAGAGSGHELNRLLLQQLLADSASWEIVSFTDVAELAAAFGRGPGAALAETA